MDNEQAKLVLDCYRPGGEDAGDPFFADALDRAHRDPGLAAWFERSRAFDDAMRRAIRADPPPPELRDAIAILTRIVPHTPSRRRPTWLPWFAAAAAALVLAGAAIFLARPPDPSRPLTVEAFASRALAQARQISLGAMNRDPAALRAWLARHGAPSDFEIPPALRNLPGLGCQSYSFDGAKVSLVCFVLSNDQIVHLFVVDGAALKDAPPATAPVLRSTAGVPWAAWSAGGKHYLLTGSNVDEQTLRRLI